jgi:exosortase D (VPLPA-CTERM-specific)
VDSIAVATSADLKTDAATWRFTPLGIALLVLASVAMVLPFRDALGALYDIWNIRPEYSHGIIIPPLAAYLLWRERAWLATTRFHGSWSGMLLIALGLLMWVAGELSTIYVIVQYSFLLVLYGLVLLLVGGAVFRRLWMPLLVLVFMVPLPAFFSNNLSLQLQLLSSHIGVAFIRLAGISVFVEGNVIDLGNYRLQVAEACDGLRYLFPLMTLSFIVSYFYRGALWKRALVFLSSIPVTVLMNSLRIGVIGITVEHWGTRMAEGLLHEFQGWMVFMLSLAVIIGIAWLLTRVGKDRFRWSEAIALDPPPPIPRDRVSLPRSIETPFVVGVAVVAAVAAASFLIPERSEVSPSRAALVEFPLTVGDWSGRRGAIEDIYLDALKLDDYLLNDYARSSGPPVNLYIAYYASQRKGQSAHSPRSCLPGGGWKILEFSPRELPFTTRVGEPMRVNRALIELGSTRQVVYYWFQQRGRTLTNEYLVKWFIFWDSLVRNRSDGALVRLSAPLLPGQSVDTVDEELTEFAAAALAGLGRYVPD